MTWKLTAEMLKEISACGEGIERFRACFGSTARVPVTRENLQEYIDKHGIGDLIWLAEFINPDLDLALDFLNQALRIQYSDARLAVQRRADADAFAVIRLLAAYLDASPARFDFATRTLNAILAVAHIANNDPWEIFFGYLLEIPDRKETRDILWTACVEWIITFFLELDPYDVAEFDPFLPKRNNV